MMTRGLIGATLAMTLGFANPAVATSLQVAPVTIEVPEPGAAATLRIRNSGRSVLNAQIRVFKWHLKNGRDVLVPTRDVVASPPFVSLQPGRRNIVRVVRTSKSPRGKEESYRLLVDELPSGPRRPGVAVNFVLRHSIPVFFSSRNRKPHQVNWSVQKTKKGLRIVARNRGDRRLRVSRLKVVNGSGKALAMTNGLLGYALGRSTVVWTLPGATRGLREGSTVTLVADGDDGPIRTSAMVRARR